MITKQNIFDVLHGIAEKVNDTEIPNDVQDYMRIRKSVAERIHVEAQDTAHMHGMYVMDAMMISQTDIIDDVGWELLYNRVSRREEIPLSFARALSYGLSADPMKTGMTCEVEEHTIENNQRILMGVVFDCVTKGMWELEDAQEFAKANCPDIPFFSKEEWENQMVEHMGEEVAEDMADLEIPKGGDDVFLFKGE